MITKLFFVLSLVTLFSILMTNDVDASHFAILIPPDDHISGMGKIKFVYILTIADSLKFVNLFEISCNSKLADGLQKQTNALPSIKEIHHYHLA